MTFVLAVLKYGKICLLANVCFFTYHIFYCYLVMNSTIPKGSLMTNPYLSGYSAEGIGAGFTKLAR